MGFMNTAAPSTASPQASSRSTLPARTVPVALVLDLILVTTFVAIGQREHTTQNGVGGLLLTASPFVIGLFVSSALFCRTAARRWVQVWPTGLGVWLGTLALGMVLRVVFDQGGAPVSFILVAGSVLAIFLLGRRAVHGALLRRRRA